ncbi:MAG: PAS domain S-box protein, partial [Oleiphilaceae bacterium]|nr:PAS domain S-box protein [Oleiphilaceae bacterium]
MPLALQNMLRALEPPASLQHQERLAFFGLFLMATLFWWQEVSAHQPSAAFYLFFVLGIVLALGNLARAWCSDTAFLQAFVILSPAVAGLVWGGVSCAYPVQDAAALMVYMLLSVLLLLAVLPFGSFNAFLFSLPVLLASNRIVMQGPWGEALHINLLVCLSFLVFWYGAMRGMGTTRANEQDDMTNVSVLSREIERLRETIEQDRQGQRELENRLKQKERDLELTIQERTRELRDANTQLSQQIALRKTISDALVKSQTRLTQAIDASRLGLIDWDLANQQFYQSAFHDLFGERELESEAVIHTLKKVIHPEDYEQVRDTLNAVLKGELEDYQLQYRVADGAGWLWIEECGRVVDKNAQGAAARILGTRRNIQSEMIRDEQVRLAKNVFDHTSEGVFVLDPNGHFLSVNPAYCAITGREASELVGQPILALSETPKKEEVYAQVLDAVRQNGRWQGELLEKRRHGDYYPQWTQINGIHDERGQLKYYAGLISDLTDRKA